MSLISGIEWSEWTGSTEAEFRGLHLQVYLAARESRSLRLTAKVGSSSLSVFRATLSVDITVAQHILEAFALGYLNQASVATKPEIEWKVSEATRDTYADVNGFRIIVSMDPDSDHECHKSALRLDAGAVKGPRWSSLGYDRDIEAAKKSGIEWAESQ